MRTVRGSLYPRLERQGGCVHETKNATQSSALSRSAAGRGLIVLCERIRFKPALTGMLPFLEMLCDCLLRGQ